MALNWNEMKDRAIKFSKEWAETHNDDAAQKVLDARDMFPNSSLAELYDPLTMPPALVKSHNELDKAVDQAYRSQPFSTEAKRMEFLFELYEKYTAELFTKEKPNKRKLKKWRNNYGYYEKQI